MRQDLAPWIEPTKKKTGFKYYEKQLLKPYQSTVAFCQWLESKGCLNKERKDNILDVGAGMGGQMRYMAKKYPKSYFFGIDINPQLVKAGSEFFKKLEKKNCKLVRGDLYALNKKYIGKYNGIVSYQTLSWLPDYELPILKMAELKADWVAITSLFYEGNVSCKAVIRDYTVPVGDKSYKESFYNTYCLRHCRELFKKCGYSKFDYIPFEINIDLPKSKNKGGMGTYTEKLANGKRIQISGPLLMNWYFILARK